MSQMSQPRLDKMYNEANPQPASELYDMLKQFFYLKSDALQILQNILNDMPGLYAEISKKTCQVYEYSRKIDQQNAPNAEQIKARLKDVLQDKLRVIADEYDIFSTKVESTSNNPSDESWHIIIDMFLLKIDGIDNMQSLKTIVDNIEWSKKTEIKWSPTEIRSHIATYRLFFENCRQWQEKAQQDATIRQHFPRTLKYIPTDLTEFKAVEEQYKQVLSTPATFDYKHIKPYLRVIESMYESFHKTFRCFLYEYQSILNRNGVITANLHNQYFVGDIKF